MSKNTPSGREACIAAIAAAGKPLTANEIATAVVESGLVPTLKGATPKATLSAQITSGAKKGETFRKVGTGRPQKFDLKSGVEPIADLVEKLRPKVQEVAERKAAPKQAAKSAAKSPAKAAAPKDGKPQASPDPKPGSAKKQTAAVA